MEDVLFPQILSAAEKENMQGVADTGNKVAILNMLSGIIQRMQPGDARDSVTELRDDIQQKNVDRLPQGDIDSVKVFVSAMGPLERHGGRRRKTRRTRKMRKNELKQVSRRKHHGVRTRKH
jgi:hypothetical protein